MAEQFRNMLQYFYKNSLESPHKDVYKDLLSEHLNAAQEQPVHIIATKQQPNNIPNTIRPLLITKKRQYLYRSPNFASVFLFGFLLTTLKNQKSQFLQNLHGKAVSTMIQQQKRFNADQMEYRVLQIDKIFQFLYTIKGKNYSDAILEPLFKKFFVSVFERKGLRKKDKQKFISEAQKLLPFFLGQHNRNFTQQQFCVVNCEAYENNQLNFNINLEDVTNKLQQIIGEGKNQIKIKKQKSQYFIQKIMTNNPYQEQQSLNQNWQNILEQSIDIRKQYDRNGLVLTGELNLTIQKSPASRRAPKSANFLSVQIKKHHNLFLD